MRKADKAGAKVARKVAPKVMLPVAREVVSLSPREAWARLESLAPKARVVAEVVADAAAGTPDADLAVAAGMVSEAEVAAAREVKAHHSLPAVRAWRKALSRLARALEVPRGGSQRARVAETVRAAREWHKAR